MPRCVLSCLHLAAVDMVAVVALSCKLRDEIDATFRSLRFRVRSNPLCIVPCAFGSYARHLQAQKEAGKRVTGDMYDMRQHSQTNATMPPLLCVFLETGV